MIKIFKTVKELDRELATCIRNHSAASDEIDTLKARVGKLESINAQLLERLSLKTEVKETMYGPQRVYLRSFSKWRRKMCKRWGYCK